MANIAIIMPYPQLKSIADSLVTAYPRLHVMTVEYLKTEQVAERARELEAAGCDFFLARGLQAQIIREATLLPVVEMRASTQELETLLLELKEEILKEHPDSSQGHAIPLGIIGFYNMFQGTEHLSKLLQVNLRVYTCKAIEEYRPLTEQAKEDGCLGVIGGEIVMDRARELGLASRFFFMGEESMREALESASLLSYGIDQQKHQAAVLETMLSGTLAAIAQIDQDGRILRVNRSFTELLAQEETLVLGKNLRELLGDIPEELEKGISLGAAVDGAILSLKDLLVYANLSPILVEGRSEGAILTLHEGRHISQMDLALRLEFKKKGDKATYHFSDLLKQNPGLSPVLTQAKKLAKYPAPLFLFGEDGVGKRLVAECIHNESPQKDNAFVAVDCACFHPDDLTEKLFGRFGGHDKELSAIEKAREGTLYLRHIERLTPEQQYLILLLIEGEYLPTGSTKTQPFYVKLIASTEADLSAYLRDGSFRMDLYYQLCSLRLCIPPLRERREDIPLCFEETLAIWESRYKRRLHCTKEALDYLVSYDWPGNLLEMNALCQRLVLFHEGRNVDESHIKEALLGMESFEEHSLASSSLSSYDAAGQELLELLKKHRGNRDKVASELGISKTTLWRRMKRHGIARDLTMED